MRESNIICAILDYESLVANTIKDLSEQINTIDEMLADANVSADVISKLEESKALLTDIKTRVEEILKYIQLHRKKRSMGTQEFF